MTRSVWAWVRMLGGAGIIVMLAWKLGTGAFLDSLRVLTPGTLAAAFLIGVVTTVASAWRWVLVARGLGLRLGLRGAVAGYYRALFLNAALPGGVLGDVDRAVRHGRDSGDVGRGVRAVVLERTAGQIVLLVTGAAVLLTAPSPVLTQLREHGPAVAVVAGGVAAGALALVAGCRRLRRGTSRVTGAARTGLAEVRRGLLARRTWPGVVLASVVVLAGHLATFVVAARAAGSGASLLTLAPLLLLALLAMAIPLTVGGWGPREGVAAWAFGAAGLSAAQGLTIAVVYGLLALVAALPGAAVLLARAAARMRRRAVARSVAALAPTSAVPAPTSAVPAPTSAVPAAVPGPRPAAVPSARSAAVPGPRSAAVPGPGSGGVPAQRSAADGAVDRPVPALASSGA